MDQPIGSVIQTTHGYHGINATNSFGDQFATSLVANYTPKPFSQEGTDVLSRRNSSMSSFWQELLQRRLQDGRRSNMQAGGQYTSTQHNINSSSVTGLNLRTPHLHDNPQSLLKPFSDFKMDWVPPPLSSSLSPPSNIPISLASSASLSNKTNVLDKNADAAKLSLLTLQQRHEAIQRLRNLAIIPTNKDMEYRQMAQNHTVTIVQTRDQVTDHGTSQGGWRRKSCQETNVQMEHPVGDNLRHKVETRIRQGQAALLDNVNILEKINEAIKRREDSERRQRAEKIYMMMMMRRKEVEWAKEAAVTIKQHIMGSYICFSAGLNVQHVICGADASQVVIKNLPPNAKDSEILELFTQQGVVEENLAIVQTEMVDGSQQATVVGKATEVETVALGLQDIEFGDRRIQFTIWEEPFEFDDCWMKPVEDQIPYIRVSWRKPESLRTILITYDSFQVNARTIISNLQKRMRPYPGVTLGHNSARNQIDLSRVPAHIALSNIQPLEKGITAVSSQTTNLSSLTLYQTFRELRLQISNYSAPIELETSIDPNIQVVKVTLGPRDNAQSIRDRLTTGHLSLNLPSFLVEIAPRRLHNFIITIQERQYNAQTSQWANLCNIKNDENCCMEIVADGMEVNISLSGNDKKAVGSMKVRIENLARGCKLDRKYWNYHFSSEDGKAFINDLFNSTGAHIRCDDERRCLIVYGTPEAVELAKGEVMNAVARLTTERWIIPLECNPSELGILCNGGVDRLKGLFEDSDISLDIPNARLILRNVDMEEVMHYIEDMERVGNETTSNNISSYESCPVCFDLVTQPIQLACKHHYCSSCLRHYLLSSLENGHIPLKCIGGDNANCGLPFSIPLIKRFVPPHLFERFLEVAFLGYIKQHPKESKACPTPDCPQIYRTTAHTNKLECCSCFNTICTGCHEKFHTGLICSERRAQKKLAKQDQLYNIWATKNGAKQCSACGTRIQKAAGCNHVTCKCGAHICWICMEIFSKAEIYPHLARAHNGG